jgi:hypothetical protein
MYMPEGDGAKETTVAVSPVLGSPRDSCMRHRQGIVAIFLSSGLWLAPVAPPFIIFPANANLGVERRRAVPPTQHAICRFGLSVFLTPCCLKKAGWSSARPRAWRDTGRRTRIDLSPFTACLVRPDLCS